ncbi:hypothetical protein T492DRAFT_1096621 [Pavlovales sp. CCMP2436]|nr:hypothetical protein T492DRAFT_1096621 [Pavlovales sp. CCMP2436]|mmetsp:Transcript_44642/g.110678  ORF Transcript_44642/g.110678 Transcript_44642/m.110678 type:complete len:252 (-) Transcript_44642:83-838(-)
MRLLASLLVAAGLALALLSAVMTRSISQPAVDVARQVEAKAGVGRQVEAAPREPPPVTLRGNSSVGCHPWPHMGYSAEYSFTWGSSFRVRDEQECCEACAAHNLLCSDTANAHKPFFHASMQKGPATCGKEAVGCNVWTFCPLDRCFAFDVHNHSKFECWLKHSKTPMTPAVGSGGFFPPEMLVGPRKHWPWSVALTVWPWPLPEQASWTSGVLAPVGSRILPQRPNMNKIYCDRHPPCPSQEALVWPPLR